MFMAIKLKNNPQSINHYFNAKKPINNKGVNRTLTKIVLDSNQQHK